MTVAELKRILEFAKDEQEIRIVVSGYGIGGTPTVGVKSMGPGFDWDGGKFMLWPDQTLKKTRDE